MKEKHLMILVRTNSRSYKGYNQNALIEMLKKNPLKKFEVISLTGKQ